MPSSILTEPIAGRSAWTGADLARDNQSWSLRFSDAALAEIDACLARVKASGTPLDAIGRAEFPLASLRAEIDRVLDELENGRGFVRIQGLPVDRYPDEDLGIIFKGVASHLGKLVSQNAKGHLLGYVRDEGLRMDRDPNVRKYLTNERQRFHTDIGADVVGLLCVRQSMCGGESMVASSMGIYNAFLAKYPWYVGVLYERFWYDWRGEEPPGSPPIYCRPIYAYHEGRLSCRVSLSLMEAAQKRDDVPKLTAVQREALQLLESLAEQHAFHYRFEPGEIQFVSNYMVLHDRMGFEDYPDPAKRRLLLRVWLTTPNARKLPAEWADTAIRGGIAAKPASVTA